MLNFRTYCRYSLKYSIADLKKLVEFAKTCGDKQFAVLDRRDIHSTIYLTKYCKEQGIQPIQGYEFIDDHVSLWALNNDGIKVLNLISTEFSKERATTLIQLEKFDLTNIVCILNDVLEQEIALAQKLFNKNLYLELEYNEPSTQDQQIRFNKVRASANKFGLITIPTSRVLYLKREDAIGHDYFINYIYDSDSHLSTDDYFAKTKADFERMPFTKEELGNIDKLGARFSMNIELGKLRLPAYDKLPEGFKSAQEYLEHLCHQSSLYNDAEQKERLIYELKDVKDANLASYFLIEKDICDWAKSKGISKGGGRGSGAGSLICYLLGITNINPLEYGLIWERFYNAGRKGSLPDIDTDFEAERRDEVVNYIIERWGKDRVFQIITFNAMAPKKAIKSALDLAQCSFDEQNKVTDLIWHKAKTIDEAIEHNPKFKAEAERRRLIFAVAKQYEGSYESFGKHAAGVIIADEPFTNGSLPMTWHEDDERFIVGYDLGAVDAYGLLKMDILGINTLNIVKRASELAKQKNKSFDINKIDLNDQRVYESIFHTGRTKGVFQLESQLGQRYSELVKPKNIEEIADLVTIIRPGAMEPGNTNLYLDVRDGKKKSEYPDDKLKDVLDSTYGACIYQEQVLKICQIVAGMSLQKADKVRAAAGKKKKKEMDALYPEFEQGCKNNNVKDDVIKTLWGWIEKFSGYGFNKSHAVCYGLLAYQTAYLKYYYPTEFYEACCNYVVGDMFKSEFDELNEIVNDARLHKVDIVPPRIDICNEKFKIIEDRKIAYGFNMIRDVGLKSIQNLQKCKDAKTYSEFLVLTNKYKIGKKALNAVILCGALDKFRITRNQMLADYELMHELTDNELQVVLQYMLNGPITDAIKYIIDENTLKLRKATGQKVPNIARRKKLTELLHTYETKDKYESIYHLAMYERKYLGVDLSVNETDGVTQHITHNCLEIKNLPKKIKVKTVIHIEKIKEILTKKGKNPGQEMAFLTGGDGSYVLDNIVIFPSQYIKYKQVLQPGRIIFVDGYIGDTGGLVANNIGILK